MSDRIERGPVWMPQRERERHPCELGAHQWAWAYLTNGGTAQRCRRCGKERA